MSFLSREGINEEIEKRNRNLGDLRKNRRRQILKKKTETTTTLAVDFFEDPDLVEIRRISEVMKTQSEGEEVMSCIKILHGLYDKYSATNELSHRYFDSLSQCGLIMTFMNYLISSKNEVIVQEILEEFIEMAAIDSEYVLTLLQFHVIDNTLHLLQYEQFVNDVMWMYSNISSENVYSRDEVFKRVSSMSYIIANNTFNNEENNDVLKSRKEIISRLFASFCSFQPKISISEFEPFLQMMISMLSNKEEEVVSNVLFGISQLIESKEYAQMIYNDIIKTLCLLMKSTSEQVIGGVMNVIYNLAHQYRNEGMNEIIFQTGIVQSIISYSQVCSESVVNDVMIVLGEIVDSKMSTIADYMYSSGVIQEMMNGLKGLVRVDMRYGHFYFILNTIYHVNSNILAQVSSNDDIYDLMRSVVVTKFKENDVYVICAKLLKKIIDRSRLNYYDDVVFDKLEKSELMNIIDNTLEDYRGEAHDIFEEIIQDNFDEDEI